VKGGSMIEEIKPLRQEVNELKELVGKGKVRKLKLSRAKVKRGRLKKGWIGVLKIDENGNMSGTKTRIEGSAFNLGKGLNDANYHATDGREVLFWNGKFPVLIQPTWKLNPLKIRKESETENETYGQPYIQAKMLKDVIKVKKGGGKGLLIIGVVAVGLFVLGKYVFKWF
jgi:hypothetical protein